MKCTKIVTNLVIEHGSTLARISLCVGPMNLQMIFLWPLHSLGCDFSVLRRGKRKAGWCLVGRHRNNTASANRFRVPLEWNAANDYTVILWRGHKYM